MRDFSVIYAFTKYLTRAFSSVFYKKITLHLPENLPAKGPVLICSNHVNAFMDPALVQCRLPRQVYSLARGDAFKKGLMSWLFAKFKMIPIFRLSEGIENLSKNGETFNRSYEVLERGHPLIIYPEGICIQEKRLRKLKKGAARIAFGVEEKNNFNLNLTILPIALNYSDAKKYRSTLVVNFGKPFQVSQFKQLYQQDKVKATNEFTKYLEAEMAKLMVIVEDRNNDTLFEQLLEVSKNQVMETHHWDFHNNYHNYLTEKYVAEKLNVFSTNYPEKTEKIKTTFSSYFNELDKYQLRDYLLREDVSKASLLSILIFLIGLPFYLLGMLTNYIPYKLAYSAANKIAKNVEFYASVNFTVGMLSWIIYYLLQLILVGLITHSWKVLLVVGLIIPLTGIFSIHFYFFIKKLKGKIRLRKLYNNGKDKYNELIVLRNRVMAEVERVGIKK